MHYIIMNCSENKLFWSTLLTMAPLKMLQLLGIRIGLSDRYSSLALLSSSVSGANLS